MPMIKRPDIPSQRPNAEPKPSFRLPHFACTDLPQALELKVFVPAVDVAGVEITTHGPDLIITARRSRHGNVNSPALHPPKVPRDYQLKLRLGFGYDYAGLRAELSGDVLTLRLPKSPGATLPLSAPQRQVA